MDHPQRDYIDQVRAMLDWLEDHPQPVSGNVNRVLFDVFQADLGDVARAGYGRLEKSGSANYFSLVKRFGPLVAIEWNAPREKVCERVLVGEKIVAAQPETVIPASPERVEPVYEWRCPPSILAGPEEDEDEEGDVDGLRVLAKVNPLDVPF